MLALTAAEMRALDRATIDGGHVPGEELMERAGRGVAHGAAKHFGSPLALRALVLCGPGNNGGDGYVAARHLHAAGARVRVVVAAPRAKVRGDALAHLGLLEGAGLRAEFVEDPAAIAALADVPDRWDWAFDALLGTGASGPLQGAIAAASQALRRLRARGTRVVAVDLPTGVSADDGAAAPGAVAADLTVTFAELKRGQLLFPGRAHCGALELVDIGLVPAAAAGVTGVEVADGFELGRALRPRDHRAHKGTAGRLLVVGGAVGMAGAAILAARAACRTGAGYVRVAAPASLVDVLAAQLLEAMPVPCAESAERTLSEAAAPALLAEAARAHAVAVGPGFSRHADALALARTLVARVDRPLVLDADALAAFAPEQADLAAALRAAPAPRVLTPHVGEMARLTGETAEAIEARRVDVAIEWAKRWGCVLVLKGAPTIVARADGAASLNPTGNPGMATAGMGDVLTGVIGALLAQGLAPWDAARLGVFAHGVAGDRAAAEIGPVGLVAGDVAERMPAALRALTTRPS